MVCFGFTPQEISSNLKLLSSAVVGFLDQDSSVFCILPYLLSHQMKSLNCQT